MRVAGVAAREMDGTCSPGHPCPAAPADVSRDALVRLLGRSVGRSPEGHVLVRGPTMRCRSDGAAGGNRTAAWCESPIGGDLSCALVRGRYAARWARYWKEHVCR